MLGYFRMATLFGLMLALLVSMVSMVSMGCDYIDTGDEEEKIQTAPSVRDIMDDAEELGIEPEDLLDRRRSAAIEDLEELYQERMDDAPTDRAIERLERQLERAIVRLNNNYDRREERLKDRLERERDDS